MHEPFGHEPARMPETGEDLMRLSEAERRWLNTHKHNEFLKLIEKMFFPERVKEDRSHDTADT